MRNSTRILAGLALATSLAAGAHAAVMTSATYTALGSSTDFPAASANGGTLALSTVNASVGSGGTLANKQPQGVVAGGVIGEIFYGVSGDLSAVSLNFVFSPSNSNFRPLLFDLGVGKANTYGVSAFNPSLETNLLDGTNVAFPSAPSAGFVEFDFSGGTITLDPTHSYAFGLYDTSGSASGTFGRANGVTTDPNGAGFQFSGDPSTATSASVSSWGGGVRNIFTGVYTTSSAVPEPASLGVLGIGAIAMLVRKRK